MLPAAWCAYGDKLLSDVLQWYPAISFSDHSRDNRLHALSSYLTYSNSYTGMSEWMFAGTLLWDMAEMM